MGIKILGFCVLYIYVKCGFNFYFMGKGIEVLRG